MLPPEFTMRAAMRWLELLSRSTFRQASAIINAEPSYADLTLTQYAGALEWLKRCSLLTETEEGLTLSSLALRPAADNIGLMLFGAAVESSRPSWITASDDLIADAGDLPEDACRLARVAGVSPSQAAILIRQVHRKLDLEERARVGMAGERALVELLERNSPGSASHVALLDDGLGYDLEFSHESGVWHLEVKSTRRRGRLAVYLSRHEHEIAGLDTAWRLVIVGLDSEDRACAVATAHTAELLSHSPKDQDSAARWESARHLLRQKDLAPGLPFCGLGTMGAAQSPADWESAGRFDWMPTPPGAPLPPP